MKRLVLFLTLFTVYFQSSLLAQQQPGKQAGTGTTVLPTGWSLSPAGSSIPLGDLPLNMAVSPNQRYLAVTNNGQGKQSLQLVDCRKKKLLHALEIPIAWLGLSFASDNRTLYVSGGNSNAILRYRIEQEKLVLKDTLSLGKPWPQNILFG